MRFFLYFFRSPACPKTATAIPSSPRNNPISTNPAAPSKRCAKTHSPSGPQGGNAVSTENLLAALRSRAKALIDDPNVPLFFGRLDYGDGVDAGEFHGERYYIGRRHVHDAGGEPMVIDWRAPVSTAFYRATPKAPMGLDRRRRFGFAHGAITGYEDEPLSDPACGRRRRTGRAARAPAAS